MKKFCKCDQCEKVFGIENGNACKLGVWRFCSGECAMEWLGDNVETMEDDDFYCVEDIDDDDFE